MSPDEIRAEMIRLDVARAEREEQIRERAERLGGRTSPASICYRCEHVSKWRLIHYRHLELANELARMRRDARRR